MNSHRSKPATLYDVAQFAEVSYQTVSRVINGSPNVSPKTRERVLHAIKMLNYRPNKAAQSLVTRRSFTLEMITFGADYYGPAQMMSNVERAAKAQGYNLMFSSIETLNSEEVRKAIDSLGGKLIDGVIIITPVRSEALDDLAVACRGIPYVLIDTPLGSNTPSVVIDQVHGTRLATQHLIDLGHRKIAEISGPLNWNAAIQRHESWLATLTENGLDPVISVDGDWTAASGYVAASDLVRNGITFTGLVSANDQMALGAIHAFRECGLDIPGDISIVGFDDIPEAAYFEPPLTTVRQDFRRLGTESVDYLIEMIKTVDIPLFQHVLYPQLVERKSTGPVSDRKH